MEALLQGLIGSLVIYLIIVLPKREYQKRLEKKRIERIEEERKKYGSEEEYQSAVLQKDSLNTAKREESLARAKEAQKKANKLLVLIWGGFILFLIVFLWLR